MRDTAALLGSPETDLRLLIADRCDRCGAQSFAVALVDGKRLDFCGHHFTEHADKIRRAATRVVDARKSIPA